MVPDGERGLWSPNWGKRSGPFASTERAKCVSFADFETEGCATVPNSKCTCGLYFTLTPAPAIDWYFEQRRNPGTVVVTEIDASGLVVCGSFGSEGVQWRSEAMTVRRVWLPSELADQASEFSADYPDAEIIVRDHTPAAALLAEFADREARFKVDLSSRIGPTGKVRKATADGELWYVKNHTRTELIDSYAYPLLDVAAYQIQRDIGLPAPDIELCTVSRRTCSVQRAYVGATALTGPYALEEIETLQRSEILDRLLGNWDAHPGNFLRVPGVGLVGIDKTDSFAYYGSDRRVLDPRWKPCPRWPMTVYGSLWTAHVGQKIELADPRDYIAPVLGLSDDYLRDVLTPYADAADRAGLLEFDGIEPFLSAVRSRRDSLERDFGIRWDAAKAVRSRNAPTMHAFGIALYRGRHV